MALENASYGFLATHPDYPGIQEKANHYKNKARNRDLVLIRMLSSIAEYERERADRASGTLS